MKKLFILILSSFFILFFITPGLMAEQTIPTDGLVVYYPFNGNANDESGNGIDGTVYNAVLSEDRYGEVDSAYSFDGSNDFIELPLSNSLDITGEISILFWMKREAEQALYYPAEKYSYILRKIGASIVVSLHDNGTIKGFNVSDIVPLQQWTHYSFTVDSDGVSRLYKNGDLIDTGTKLLPLSTSANPLRIGKKNGGHYSYNGDLDEFMIYNRALTECEIKVLSGNVPDSDLDGISDCEDNCPDTDSGDIVDEHGCSPLQLVDETCPIGGVWKNHGEYVSCVAHETQNLCAEGLIGEDLMGEIVSDAAVSDIGKKNQRKK